MLQNLQAGVIPHYTIPRTLGALANTNAYGVIPYLKDILNIMLPLLGGLKADHLKQAFAFGMILTFSVKVILSFYCSFTEFLRKLSGIRLKSRTSP